MLLWCCHPYRLQPAFQHSMLPKRIEQSIHQMVFLIYEYTYLPYLMVLQVCVDISRMEFNNIHAQGQIQDFSRGQGRVVGSLRLHVYRVSIMGHAYKMLQFEGLEPNWKLLHQKNYNECLSLFQGYYLRLRTIFLFWLLLRWLAGHPIQPPKSVPDYSYKSFLSFLFNLFQKLGLHFLNPIIGV